MCEGPKTLTCVRTQRCRARQGWDGWIERLWLAELVIIGKVKGGLRARRRGNGGGFLWMKCCNISYIM
jgi:hypothetical protein